jgi:Mg2+ and Co2+ transporter CorA
MLTSVVEDIIPIIYAYRLQLEIMQDRFNSEGLGEDGYLLKIHSCQREIEWVQRKVKPIKRIVRHMIDDVRIGAEISHYLEDVEDTVVSCTEDLTSVINLISVMKTEFESFQDRRLNNMLGVLTFCTSAGKGPAPPPPPTLTLLFPAQARSASSLRNSSRGCMGT